MKDHAMLKGLIWKPSMPIVQRPGSTNMLQICIQMVDFKRMVYNDLNHELTNWNMVS